MTDDLIQVDFMLHTFEGKQYLAKEDAEQMAALIETGSRIDGELRAEIERLREALCDIRDYIGNNQVIYDADDAIAMKAIARAALGEKE